MSNSGPVGWLDEYFLKQAQDGSGNVLPARPVVQYTGTGVSVVDDAINNRSIVTITAGGGPTQGTTTLANGLNSNVPTGAQSTLRFSGPNAAFSVGGLAQAGTPSPGQQIALVNTTSQPMTLVNEDASSTAAYRIRTQTGANVQLQPKQSSTTLVYDGTISRWVLQNVGVSQPVFVNARDFGAQADGVTDDTVAIQTAVNAVLALGGGHVHLPAGNYLLGTKQGTNGEWILIPNNTTQLRISGEGVDKTTIKIPNGVNPGGGWSCVFGNMQFTVVGGGNNYTANLMNVWVHDMTIDCNAANNLWSSPNFGGLQEPFIYNSAVAVINGDNCRVERVWIKNFNGVHAIQAGEYQSPSSLTNVSIESCRVDEYFDPNQGDASIIKGAFTRGRVINCTVNRPAGAFGTNNAYEVHSVDCDFGGNIAFGYDGGLTIAGDLQDGVAMRVHDCIFTNCTIGVSPFSGSGGTPRKLQLCSITDCAFECYYSAVYCDAFTDGSTQGFYDLTVTDNTMSCIPGTVVALPAAIYIAGQSGGHNGTYGGGVTVRGNRISGWSNAAHTAVGIKFDLPRATDVMDGVVIADNEIENCGTYGIYITGASGSLSSQYRHMVVRNNMIKDSAVSPLLVDGIHVDGNTDNTCDFIMNKVHNYSNADLAFNTANYSMNAGLIICIDNISNGGLEIRNCVSGTINNILACYNNGGVMTWFATGALLIDQTNGSTAEVRYANGQHFRVSNGSVNEKLTITDTGIKVPVLGSGNPSGDGWIVSDVNGDLSAVVMSQVSGNRPGSPATGQMMFDTTLGYPIWYSTAHGYWVNSTGAGPV